MGDNDNTPGPDSVLDGEEDGVSLVAGVPSALSAITSSEVIQQLDAAHRYPRSVTLFKRRTLEIATIDADVAASCMYSLKRGGKHIVGPSVRLAEIVAGTWQNLQAGARPMEVRETEVVAQGVAWDMENNTKITVECVRRITETDGRRYNQDMIAMTQNAANSIALRNAIFRVVPRALISPIFQLVMGVAVGEAKTMSTRRLEQLEYLAKMGADQASVLAALGRNGLDEITLEDIAVLIGYGNAIKEGSRKVDDVFPDVSKPGPMPSEGAPQGRRMSLGKAAAKPSPQPATPKKETSTTGAPVQGQQPLPTSQPSTGAPADDDKANRDAAAPTAEELAKLAKEKTP